MKIFALLFYTKLQLKHNLINNSTIGRYDILTGLHNPLLTPKFNTRQHECQINICWQQQITQHSEIQQQHHNNNNNPSKNNNILPNAVKCNNNNIPSKNKIRTKQNKLKYVSCELI